MKTISTPDEIYVQHGKTYYLEEVNPPDKYSPWDGKVKLTVNERGEVLLESDMQGTYASYKNGVLTLKDGNQRSKKKERPESRIGSQ